MEKLSVTSKFFLLYSFLFLLFFMILVIFGAAFQVIAISLSALSFFYLFTFLFIRKEIVSGFNVIKNNAEKIKIKKDEEIGNNFDSKIELLQDLKKKLEDNRDDVTNKDILEVESSLEKIIDRLIHELNIAKVFKVNRNEFLGNVAHELRTPIFAIQLSIETLLEGAINDPDVNMDFLNRALSQSSRLNVLVDDLISISKLEAGMRMSKRYFLINDLIEKTINELDKLAANRKIEIEFTPKIKNNTTVFGDIERIKQVLTNLIDNAIKYTPDNGRIYLETYLYGKDVIIKVEDTGTGIPEKDLPRIFERFYRVDKNRSRDIEGSGLGLSIVKHILELHNSQIKVESTEGKGTKFEFNLPK